MTSRDERDAEIIAAPHDVDACYDDGEGRWSLVCSCQWEAWGYATENRVRQIHAAHKLDPTADKPVTVTS